MLHCSHNCHTCQDKYITQLSCNAQLFCNYTFNEDSLNPQLGRNMLGLRTHHHQVILSVAGLWIVGRVIFFVRISDFAVFVHCAVIYWKLFQTCLPTELQRLQNVIIVLFHWMLVIPLHSGPKSWCRVSKLNIFIKMNKSMSKILTKLCY